MQDLNDQFTLNQYEKIFTGLPEHFNERAMELFHRQVKENLLYSRFVERFYPDPDAVRSIGQIPFLPVSFFKTDPVQTGDFLPERVFESSGTTGQKTARHRVKDIELYRQSFMKGFKYFYLDPRQYCILGLLPSYLERSGSSLIYMVDELIRQSQHPDSGFYLDNLEQLFEVLKRLEQNGQPTILIGVSFALLDFAEKFPMNLRHTIIMETGGMKGRRQEITRSELHSYLEERLGVSVIHSEYGMTELLSQAYSLGKGIYRSVPWMKMLAREEDDPLQVRESGEGLLNIIDLANQDSCAFIATDDVVKLNPDGSFEILGRMDNSDIRGCSLLVV